MVAEKYPHNAPDWNRDDLIDQRTVSACLPPQYQVYEDFYHSSWEMAWRGAKGRRCRAWQLYGKGRAAEMLVAHAWHAWTKRTGEKCPIEGVKPAPLASRQRVVENTFSASIWRWNQIFVWKWSVHIVMLRTSTSSHGAHAILRTSSS